MLKVKICGEVIKAKPQVERISSFAVKLVEGLDEFTASSIAS